MRKLLFAFALLLTFSANSQKIEYGIKGGLNMSDLVGDIEDTDNYYSFHIGFLTEFKILDKFSIQPEIQYSSQGTNYNSVVSAGNYEDTIDGELRLQYLNLPIIAKFNIAQGFFVQAGPQIGYLAQSKQVTKHISRENGEIVNQEYSRTNLRKLTNEIDYGAVAGLGYQFKDGLLLEVRYYYGLNDVIKNIDENRNSVFQVSIGYKFQ